ncbi:MAG: hypothetical protein GY730_00230 [bacterium]|nr:hypothetical protein [bacterium]
MLKYKKEIIVFIIIFLIIKVPLTAKNTYNLDRKKGIYIVDDFEDANIKKNPPWWGLGDMIISYVYNSIYNRDDLGKVSIKLTGRASDLYVGGFGTYFGIDATKYNAVKMKIHGIGRTSGSLKIELYEDDNLNWQIEPHPHDPSMTMADDCYSYILDVNWKSWQTVIIPFKHFTDYNPGIGDDTWNPDLRNESGGLLQLQLLAIAASAKDNVNIIIDKIELVKNY